MGHLHLRKTGKEGIKQTDFQIVSSPPLAASNSVGPRLSKRKQGQPRREMRINLTWFMNQGGEGLSRN